MSNNKKQHELELLIKTGEINKIREFLICNFHSIQHTKSFALLIDRLVNKERMIQQAKSDANQEIKQAKLDLIDEILAKAYLNYTVSVKDIKDIKEKL
jgi:hypothetical protein